MDGSNTFSDAGEETTIVRLDCSMEGTPEPDIRWLKVWNAVCNSETSTSL